MTNVVLPFLAASGTDVSARLAALPAGEDNALVRQTARNLVVRFPAPQPRREVILCAHLDSKTELLDHGQREVLLRLGGPAMGLALLAGAGMAAERLLVVGTASRTVHWLAFLAALPVAVYGLGMGASLVGGRFSRQPSNGAVDNGAAVALLLDLARRLHRGSLSLDHTAVALLFTVGEEAQMQGALAYVGGRTAWPLPTCAVNLDVVGQDGRYLLWEEDGTAMRRFPADATLNRALGSAVEAVAGWESGGFTRRWTLQAGSTQTGWPRRRGCWATCWQR